MDINQKAVTWLDTYKKAWETQNGDIIADLFTVDGQYFETPFLVHSGREMIRQYWSDAPGIQKDINFGYKILSTYDSFVIAHWNSKFIKAGIPKELDGVFLLDLDEEGRCKILREWWHSKPVTNVEE